MGMGSQASGAFATALGPNAQALNTNTIAIGKGAQATAAQAISIGTGNVVSGANAGAIGDPSYVSGAGTYTYGNNNGTAAAPVAASNSGAFGNNNALPTASTTGIRVIGNSNTVNSSNVMVMGNSVTVGTGLDGAVVLGNASTVSAAVDTASSAIVGITYTYATAGAAPADGDVVSVGTATKPRQIQNVANGQVSATSLDAINGSRLYAVANTLAGKLTHFYSVNSTDSTSGNYNNDGATGIGALAAGIDTVAAGLSGTAVGLKANAAGDNSTALGANTVASTAGTVAVGNSAKATADGATAMGNFANAIGGSSVALGSRAQATQANAVALGYSAQATAISGIALGQASKATANFATAVGVGAQATLANSVALGTNSVTTVNAGAVGYDPLGDTPPTNSTWKATTAAVSVGNGTTLTRQITSVAAGTNDTDAVNVAQLKKLAAGEITFTGNTNSDTGANGTQQTLGSTIAISGGATGASSNANVKTVITDGKVDIQLLDAPTFTGTVTAPKFVTSGANAITVDGAAGTIGGLTNTTWSGTPVSGQAATEDQLKSVSDVANKGWNLQANGDTADNVAPGDTVQLLDGKNIKVTRTGKDVTIATADEVTFDKVTVGPVTIDKTAGIDAGNTKITGVAAGTAPTDAVNVSQLTPIVDGLGGGAAVNPDGTVTGPSYTITKTDGTSYPAATNVGDALSNLNSEVIKPITFTGDSGSSAQKLGSSFAIVAGNNADTSTANLKTTVTNGQVEISMANAPTFTGTVTAPKFVTSGANAITVDGAAGTIGGLTNTTWSGTPVSGQAATEDQLASATAAAKTEVAAGTNVTSVAKTTGANGQDIYTVNANGTTASAGSTAVTVTAGTKDANNVTDYAVDLSQASKDSLAKADTALQNITSSDPNLTVGTKDADGNITLDFADAPTFGGTVTAPTFVASGANPITMDGGTGKITGLTAGTLASDSKDAVNGSQLYAVGSSTASSLGGTSAFDPVTGKVTAGLTVGTSNYTTVQDALSALNTAANKHNTTTAGTNIEVVETANADGSKNYEVKTKDDVTFTKVTVGGITMDAASNKVSGLANGTVSTDSSDAINGSQLYGVSNSVKNILGGNSTVNPDGSLSMTNVGGTGYNNIDDAIKSVNTAANKGWNLTANGASSSNVAPGATVDLNNTDGNIAITKTDNNVTFNLSKDLKADSVTTGNTTMNTNGVSISGGPNGTVSLTGSGLDNGGNKITNVANGAVTADSKDAVNGSQLYEVKTSITDTVNNATFGLTAQDGQSVTNNLNKTVSVVGGADSSASASASNVKTVVKDGKLEVQIVDAPTFSGEVTANGGLTVGDNLTVKSGTTVDMGGNKITNVAEGTADTDAVNVGQVNAALNTVNQNINNLGNKISEVGKESKAGSASAIATANLPQSTIPGMGMTTVGLGTYDGQSAIAVGLSKMSDNGKWVIKASATTNTQGKVGAGVGVGFHW